MSYGLLWSNKPRSSDVPIFYLWEMCGGMSLEIQFNCDLIFCFWLYEAFFFPSAPSIICKWNLNYLPNGVLLSSLQVFWAFSIYLEAVAILPQLVLLQRSGNVDNLTGQYVFFLGYSFNTDRSDFSIFLLSALFSCTKWKILNLYFRR